MCVIFGESVSKKKYACIVGYEIWVMYVIQKRIYLVVFWSLLDKTQALLIYIIKYTSLEFSPGIALKITQA